MQDYDKFNFPTFFHDINGIIVEFLERKNLIDYKLETISTITASVTYYFLKTEKGCKKSYSTIRNYVSKNKYQKNFKKQIDRRQKKQYHK